MSRLLILAHRGASAYAPENTYAAFDRARELGAAGVETDVQLTKDGVLALLHDETVDRTTDGRGPITSLEWSELAKLDAGNWFGERFAGERIPRLDEFLDRYLGGMQLCIEVKTPEAADPLTDLLQARGLASESSIQLTSFSRETMEWLHEALPAMHTGQLTLALDQASILRAADAGLSAISPRLATLNLDQVSEAHRHGLRVGAWGLESKDDLRHAADLGIDVVTLNWPDWSIEA